MEENKNLPDHLPKDRVNLKPSEGFVDELKNVKPEEVSENSAPVEDTVEKKYVNQWDTPEQSPANAPISSKTVVSKNSIYPGMTAEKTTSVSAESNSTGLPFGLVVIAVLTLATGAISVVQSVILKDDLAGLYAFFSVLTIAVAIWLLKQSNKARIIYIIFSVFIVATTLIQAVALYDFRSNLDSEINQSRAQAKFYSQKEDAYSQSQANKYNDNTEELEGISDEQFLFLFLMTGLDLAYFSWAIWYLTRKSTKQYF